MRRVVLVTFLVTLLATSAIMVVRGDEDVEDEVDFDSASASEDAAGQAPKEKVKYVKPTVSDGAFHFLETFESNLVGSKWVKSKAKKDDVDETIAKYDGEWSIEPSSDAVLEGDLGLVLKSKAKHHAISSRLVKPFDFSKKQPLIVQYEVKFQNPLECGGAYVKLLSNEPGLNLDNFFDKTSFSIMFGPDKCGNENKFHFIVRYKHPKTGVYEEKHAKKSEIPDMIFSDGRTHLYTLVLRPDDTFSMYIDQNEVNSGSLLKDLTPAIMPAKEIVDPNDHKPENWDDREKIPDPDAVKPEDWDENEPKTIVDSSAVIPDGWLESETPTIPDPTAVKPEDWDTDTDGDWEAPQIDNPKCKGAAGCGKWEAPTIPNPKYRGKWKAPLIENTNYQGKWEPRRIPNPEYFEDNNPFSSLTSFAGVGLELWSMTDRIYFDNFIITDDETVAGQFATDTWAVKRDLEASNSKSTDNIVSTIINATNDKPWLWAVYILVILIPIVLIVVFCCGKSQAKDDRAARAKKTDEASKDDEAANEEDTGAAEEDAEEGANDEQDPVVAEEKVPNKSDLEDQDQEEEEAEEEPAAPAAKASPKTTSPKRRARKE